MSCHESTAEQIMLDALEQEPGARQSFIQQACAEDKALASRVEALLRAHGEPNSLLDGWRLAVTVDPALQVKLGTQIGPYILRELLGEGGMGSVYVAEQQAPVHRKVALKIIKPGMDTRQVIARFEAERQALALMDHPNIAKVFDAGTTSGKSRVKSQEPGVESEASLALDSRLSALDPSPGRPYFVMELVQGVPITEYCDECNLTTRERLELFVLVCQAVQHAHQKGVIHRDIKPTNVLVAMQDGQPAPKIIDFGVAKAIGEPLTEHTLTTGFAQMIGSPLYMSPEQAELSPLGVDTRSDIYSLGVLLYELMTGTTPFDKDRLHAASYDELRRIIREEEPPRPSARITTLAAEKASTVAERRRTDSRRLGQQVRGELDWIVMKCLDKDRNRRYESASALAEDVARHLRDEPVQACPPSAVYRLKKFVRRNKAGVSIAASVVLLLAVIGGFLGWTARDRALRVAAIDQAMEAALQTSVTMQESSLWTEALAVIKGARSVLSQNAGSPRLRQRIDERLAELQMAIQLERITLEGRTRDFGEEGFYLADRETEREFARAFRDFGIDVEQLPPAQATELIRAKGIRAELVDGLEYWAAYRAHSAGEMDPLRKRLLELAGSLDDDPWREQLRAAWLTGGPDKMIALLPIANKEDRPMTPLMLGALPMLDLFGHKAEVVELLRKAWFRHPDDFWVLFELGSVALDPDDGIRFCTAALAIRPQTAALHNQLSAQCNRKKQYDEAISHAREAIRLRPTFAGAQFNLGQALAGTGQRDEALAAYRAAVEIAPNLWDTHYNLANALRDQGLVDEAIAEYRKTIGMSSGFFLEAHARLWDALRRQGRLDERFAEYREALRLQPAESQGLTMGLGRHFMEQKEYADAEAVLRECVASSEMTNPDAWTTFNRKSMLGGALVAQAGVLKSTNPAAAEAKLAEAEPLLLAAYAGLKERESKIPTAGKIRLTEALQRLVDLYTEWNKPDEAEKWQKELDARRS